MLHHAEGDDLIPANIELSRMEMLLVYEMSRETTLKTYLEPLKKSYDYVLIDCMLSLGMLTINALAAADSVIVPVQAHYLLLKGMTQLMQTIEKVQRQINPPLKVDGILLTLADMRTNLARVTETSLKENYGKFIRVYQAFTKEVIRMPRERIQKYFPPKATEKQIEDTIVKALELYRKRERSLER